MRIAIDIDSTLHHYWDVFADVAARRFGVELAYESQSTWAITRLKPEQVKAVVEATHQPERVLGAEPYPGAVEAVREWKEAGHFIHITSHRADHCHPATSEWLDRIGLPHDELYCSYDKIARCCEIGIDLLIDDSPVNLDRALEAGMHGATLLHPWNADFCTEEPGIFCADDWPGLAEALAPLLGIASDG